MTIRDRENPAGHFRTRPKTPRGSTMEHVEIEGSPGAHHPLEVGQLPIGIHHLAWHSPEFEPAQPELSGELRLIGAYRLQALESQFRTISEIRRLEHAGQAPSTEHFFR